MLALTLTTLAIAAAGEFPAFREHAIDPEAGVGLAITVVDVNNDGRPDVVGVSDKQVAWYENPSWERHLIADTIRNSNVCIAAHDLDGDGTPEFALGADWQFNNTESGGALFLLRAKDDVTQPWQVITLVEREPTLHRIRWADIEADGRKELIVAPLKGIGTTGPNFQERGVRLYLLRPPDDPFQTPWNEELIDESLHLLHNVWAVEPDNFGRDVILAASFEGITRFALDGTRWIRSHQPNSGNPQPLPNSGAGEVKTSTVKPFMIATIEPWHGHQAVVYAQTGDDMAVERHVIDDTLAGGHAIWWADFDSDGQDELLVGFRDKAKPTDLPGLNIYEITLFEFRNGTDAANPLGTTQLKVTKHVIDDGGMATEDALAADLNADGRPDIVAFGRATQNIKWYENLGEF